MTEPSKEAVEQIARALAHEHWAERGLPPYSWDKTQEGAKETYRSKARSLLGKYPIPDERNRWEQEVRERLLRDEVIEQISNQIWVDPVRTALDMALDSIFGEAEPVEDGERDE
jgi:hypothetical protein